MINKKIYLLLLLSLLSSLPAQADQVLIPNGLATRDFKAVVEIGKYDASGNGSTCSATFIKF